MVISMSKVLIWHDNVGPYKHREEIRYSDQRQKTLDDTYEHYQTLSIRAEARGDMVDACIGIPQEYKKKLNRLMWRWFREDLDNENAI